MANVIVKNKETAFVDVLRNTRDIKVVLQGIQDAIKISFKQDGDRGNIINLSDTEVRRRFTICEKWFRIMRGDCGYSVEKAIDFLPRALRSELDNVDFEPPKNDTGWSPDSMNK